MLWIVSYQRPSDSNELDYTTSIDFNQNCGLGIKALHCFLTWTTRFK